MRLATLSVVGFFLTPVAAFSCACCAESGERFELTHAMSDWERGMLADLRSDGRAVLYVTPCDLDCVSGIIDPQHEYGVTLQISRQVAEFAFTDEIGRKRGTLTFAIPGGITRFAVDIDVTTDHEPLLYIESRLTGALTGTGDFSGADQAELIIAARGNMCSGPGGAHSWMLSVDGGNVEYRLFGGFHAG